MTQLVGILNLTPDSFSGDGLHAAVDDALMRIDAMIADGVSVIDIGAQSTRPGAAIVSPDEEWKRLAPVIESLGERLSLIQFSIDTGHIQTARRAMTYGFDWLNDTSGGRERAMSKLAKECGCMYVLMHAVSVPADPSQTIAPDEDATAAVLAWAETSITALEGKGIMRSRIIFDPGIGFGKTAEQSLQLIRDISQFKALEVPLMVGHSRKSFLSLFTDKKAGDRDEETLIVSKYLISQGVDYLRVHNVKGHAELLETSIPL